MIERDTSTAYLMDQSRSVCLCRSGSPGHFAAVAVDGEGVEHMAIIDEASIGNHSVRYDASCADVVHEQIGPLPVRWSARVRYAPLRCGRPTKAGKPCRVEVSRPGGTCGWHRGAGLRWA